MVNAQIHDKLKEIYQSKLLEISLIEVDALPERRFPIRNFKETIDKKEDLGLIAEVKKASPSKGIIRENFDLHDICDQYQTLGADAISVLTDEKYFQGHKDYLTFVKQRVDCPILRKDFIIDEKQIYESYSIGADIILLIVAMLSFKDLKKLIGLADRLNLQVLTEAHTKKEIESAIAAGANIIGINNRDLNTFNVNIMNSINLAKEIPQGITKIAESGIHSRSDIERIKDAGYDAVLIGEAFMASQNINSVYYNLFQNDSH